MVIDFSSLKRLCFELLVVKLRIKFMFIIEFSKEVVVGSFGIGGGGDS